MPLIIEFAYISIMAVWNVYFSVQTTFNVLGFQPKSPRGTFPLTTTTLPIFYLTSFWILPSNLHNSLPCFLKFISFSAFLAQRKPVNRSLMQSPHTLITRTWSSYKLSISPNKLCNFGGQPPIPLEILLSCLASYLDPRLHNSTSQHFQQELWNVPQQSCLTQNLCKSRQQSTALPRNCTNFLGSQPNSQPEMCISFKLSNILLHVQLS